MSISLNEKIRERDLRNLALMTYSKARSWRVFKVVLVFMPLLGALFYTVWEAVLHGWKGTGAWTDYLLVDLFMVLGNAVHVVLANLLLAVMFLGVPVLVLAGWLGYRTYKRGHFAYWEAAAVSAGLAALSGVFTGWLYHGSFGALYDRILGEPLTALGWPLIAVVCAVICRWMIGVMDADKSLEKAAHKSAQI